MPLQIDLIWLTDTAEAMPDWPLGNCWTTEPSPKAIHALTEKHLTQSTSDAWLFWHCDLGEPDLQSIQALSIESIKVWHAGLNLGMAGLPEFLDFVNPSWMLNVDANPTIESTSWRLSLKACLIATDVLRKTGGISPNFTSLKGASLDLGYRYIKAGVLMRHHPSLVSQRLDAQSIPLEDEIRFVRHHFNLKHQIWMLFRASLAYRVALKLFATWWKMRSESVIKYSHYPYERKVKNLPEHANTVSIIIPTLDRYSYLRVLLEQLREQTIAPLEVIVVDQTPRSEHDASLVTDFADLPMVWIYQKEAGQSSSRNQALKVAKGQYLLFLDDDDEVSPNLIEQHLTCLAQYQCDVSSGYAYEPSAPNLPYHFTYLRASDVFPTNNSMIKREILLESGLFDLAYDHGQKADGDLGMRLYLSGVLMIYNPDISVLHHHAPRGGLRQHKARVVTYAKSRQSLSQRRLPHITEVYLLKRYFSPRQVSESLALYLLGTFSIRGSRLRQFTKVLVAIFQLPDTIHKLRERSRGADDMLNHYPQIPEL